MWFDVVEARTHFLADGLQRGDLGLEGGQQGIDGQGFKDIGPAEAGAVGIGRMGADGDAVKQGQFDAAPHGIGVSGVTAAGNIGGADKGEDFVVSRHPFAHVAVKVDRQHATSLR